MVQDFTTIHSVFFGIFWPPSNFGKPIKREGTPSTPAIPEATATGCHWDTAIFNHLYKFWIVLLPESVGPPFKNQFLTPSAFRNASSTEHHISVLGLPTESARQAIARESKNPRCGSTIGDQFFSPDVVACRSQCQCHGYLAPSAGRGRSSQ